ncbi:hypothetical protein AK812_SmicGene44414 [Symbiodinium microadriaticum]|uniref:Uncharacterized protein n=1 Tax=Symbiodinium microadriaticum TaxID=2951 RepID=A0A1Q9BYI1_SYMMI|nr:hypothetical protein AK812_SmicGene44414 [Symbiodinium microadriaticum]
MAWPSFCLLLGLASTGESATGLASPRWRRIPTGSVRPAGWLKAQLELQASALTSHLPFFWDNIKETSWLGGNYDSTANIHQNTPYWLNGAVPLHLQVDNPVLAAVVEDYVFRILDRQAADGWLGPDTDRSDYYSRYPFLLAMVQYHEGLPDGEKRERILQAVLRFFAAVRQRIDSGLLVTIYSSLRAPEFIFVIHYFVDFLTASGRDAQDLLDLAEKVYYGSFDWNSMWFNSSFFPRTPLPKWVSSESNGVSNAQAVKRGVVWGRQSGGTAAGFAESWFAWEQLQRFHGQVHGGFGTDEQLAGRMPSRGMELCAVVESMWSMALAAQLAPTDGQAAEALDFLETLAFNALPGSLSDDLWSHPYLQFVNSYVAVSNQPQHIWASDGPQAAMYGLSPNFECCTANFHQGYPKFTSSLFFEDPVEAQLISAVWAPSVVNASVGQARVELRTSYPFNTSLEYWIQNLKPFLLKVRLPKFLRSLANFEQSVHCWLEGRPVHLLKEPQFVKDGFLLFHISASESNRLAVRIEFPMAPRLERSADQGVSAFLGPLLLALDLAEQHRSVHYYGFASSDWNITASLPWRLGMPSDPKLTVTKMAKPGEKPMSNRDCPVRVEARLMELAEEDWPEEHGAPGRLNRSFHPKAPKAVRRSLLPYGCSSIRIAAFPALSLSEE